MIAEGLDKFTRCSVSACDWRMQMREGMSATRCYLHGGPAVAQYETSSDGIETLRVRFMPRENDPDFEPAA